MAHVHQHAEDQTSYYLDQLFMIAISGALAGVTITLWYSGLLGKILHPKFHIWVLLGGLSLLTLVVLRAAAVWRSVDEMTPHTHDHGHDHDHACCGHEHHHEHAHAHASTALATAPTAHVHSHDHGHAHTHTHAHSHDHGHAHGWAPWRYVVLLLPVVLYFLILSNPAFDREPVYNAATMMDLVMNFIIRFRSIVWEALPFIVLGAIIAGLLEELLPQQAITRFLPRNPFLAVAIGGLIGLVFPMCECGIVPVMRRLLRKGLPLSCCIAYVLAGPIINVVVLLSTFVAFSGMENTFEGGKPSYQMGAWWMMGLRAGLGYLVAVSTALLVEWQHRKHGDALLTPLARPSAAPAEGNGTRKKTLWERVNNVSETALHDFVDITVFLILGALLSAGTVLFVSQDRIAELSRQHAPLAILAMMGMAILLCLCSEADAFVAASFVTLRPSAKLAFLVLGPMIDFKLYFMYTRVFRPRLILTIYLSVVTQVFVLSYATHLLWEKYAPQLVHPQRPPGPQPDAEALASAARSFGLASNPAGGGPLTAAAALVLEKKTERVAEVSFSMLEMAAASPEARNYYDGRRVKLRGQFYEIDEKTFRLVRYKIICCGADAVPLKAVIRLKGKPQETLPVAQLRGKWVLVTGEVQFLPQPGTNTFYTTLVLHPTEQEPLFGEAGQQPLIELVPRDNNPYSY
jgi:uncharacterized protein